MMTADQCKSVIRYVSTVPHHASHLCLRNLLRGVSRGRNSSFYGGMSWRGRQDEVATEKLACSSAAPWYYFVDLNVNARFETIKRFTQGSSLAVPHACRSPSYTTTVSLSLARRTNRLLLRLPSRRNGGRFPRLVHTRCT